jgi:hypothetical protein
MKFVFYFLLLPYRLLQRGFRATQELNVSDPLRLALDKGWLYCKYAALALFIILNLTVFSGLPHVRIESTAHTTRDGLHQGFAKYLGPLGVQTIDAQDLEHAPPRIVFIPIQKVFSR